LMNNQRLTVDVKNVLHSIFSWYVKDDQSSEYPLEPLRLRASVAARLWYKCGLKLSNLEAMVVSKSKESTASLDPNICVSFEDFLKAVELAVSSDYCSQMDSDSVDVSV